MSSNLRKVWGDPNVSSLTHVSITTCKKANSKKTHKKSFQKHFVVAKIFDTINRQEQIKKKILEESMLLFTVILYPVFHSHTTSPFK